MEKRKLKITLEVLNEFIVEFPETKKSIEEHLDQKCLKEKISVEEVIYIFRTEKRKINTEKTFCIL